MLVATKQVTYVAANSCRYKRFVATKICLSRQTYFCRDKGSILSLQTRVCRDKTFVATKVILVAATANDRQEPFVTLETCWMNATFTASNRDEGI